MTLAQNRLYVGWKTWTGVNNQEMKGQITVLNAADGSQRSNYSFQVYSATSDKPLWHVTYPSGSSEPARALRIVNGLLYATISTNNGVVGEGQDSLAAYDVTSGQKIGQSPISPAVRSTPISR